MPEFVVPELPDDEFREHYRRLILGAVLRSAEAQAAIHATRGHRRRARQAEDVAALLRAEPTNEGSRPVLESTAPGEIPTRETVMLPARRMPGHRRLRLATRILWLVVVALLVCDVAVFGVESWTTSVADVAVIVVTLAWFLVAVGDLTDPPESPAEQLELFS